MVAEVAAEEAEVAAEEAEVAAEEGEVVEEAAQRQVERLQEEEMQNSSERNHLPSAEIDKMSTDSFQISKDICR